MTPSEEYLKRADPTEGILRLTSLHHHVMDKLHSEFQDEFTIDDACELFNDYSKLLSQPAIEEKPSLKKLFVIRSINALVDVGILKESQFSPKCYFFDRNR